LLRSAVSDYIDRIVDGRGLRQRVITQPRPEPDMPTQAAQMGSVTIGATDGALI
jgi:hypothetical protein